MSQRAEDAEREFFRSEFANRFLIFALTDSSRSQRIAIGALVASVNELRTSHAQVLVVASLENAQVIADALQVNVSAMPDSTSALADVWAATKEHGVGVIGTATGASEVGATLARCFGVSKLVLADPEGGWGSSFASDQTARNATVRSEVASAVVKALDGGVSGVNLCRPEELDAELFTFDGAGTLFTRDAYVSVSRLCADDFPMVENLVLRGIEEGFLRDRSRTEIIRLALNGFGARVAPSGHLAGIGALEVEAYATEHLGEVTCLYTVNRFAGEGIASELVAGLVERARRQGVAAVFACTVNERAASMFVRCGFREVQQDRLPERKWIGYDPERRKRLISLWLDVPAGPGEECVS